MSFEPLQILEHRPMGRDAWLLRLKPPAWDWVAGQLIALAGENEGDQRDYSIASGVGDDTLDVIYRLIPHGVLTPWLVTRKQGDFLQVQGPYGRFVLKDIKRPVLFCATGTGVAPCRSFLRSHPELDLLLLHGVRYPEDLYFREELEQLCDYRPFCSREPFRGKCGRLTDALRSIPLPDGVQGYLCGANEMIYEAEEILSGRGVPRENLFHEPYYYRAYDD